MELGMKPSPAGDWLMALAKYKRILTRTLQLVCFGHALRERPRWGDTEAVRIGFSPRKLFWEMHVRFRGASNSTPRGS